MSDNLTQALKHLQLNTRVFQSGPLCSSARFDRQRGLCYLHIVRSGLMEVTSPEHNLLRIDQPSLLLYLKPTDHQLLPRSAEVNSICASFEVADNRYGRALRLLPQFSLLRLDEAPSLDALLQALFMEANQNQLGRQAILDRLMEAGLIQILRELLQRQAYGIGILAGLADNKLSKALNAIHQQPEQAWTLEQLAQVAGMSRARFAEHFKSRIGLTPGAYLNEQRMALAQALLLQGDNLDGIAQRVGYGSASSLVRAFKALHGLSPGQWEKHQRTDRLR